MDFLRGALTNLMLGAQQEELWAAAQSGDGDTVARLVCTQGIDVNWRKEPSKATAFLSACQGGHASVVEVLLRCPGVDVNLPQHQGATPFLLACVENHLEVVRLLLADPRVLVNRHMSSGKSHSTVQSRVATLRWSSCCSARTGI